MEIYLSIVLIAWIVDSCYATNLIYTSKGVIDPNPYVGMKKNDRAAVHSRRKRSTDFTSSEAQAIVDKHNDLRSSVSPEAADMSFMVWDENLATLAQQWSEECIWDHGFPEPNLSKFSSYGQNLWLGSGSADNPPDGAVATQSWYNEQRMYTYETRECTGVCDHYYQVVWATSYSVGCGLSFCETTNDGHNNAWIITCNYGPAGNYNRHPYISGPSCTKCSSGVGQCYNNLCRLCEDHNEECICNQKCHNCGTLNTTSCRCDCQPGFMLDDCSAECGDTHTMCNVGWFRGQCSGYEYVREGCRLMCNLCSPVPEDFVCDNIVEEDHSMIEPTSPSGDDIVEVVPTSPPGEDGQNQCAEEECQNGGTFDVSTCKCACPSGYQGNTCEENKEQVKNGVQVTIAASITVWDGIKSALLQSIADILDEFCNTPTNYGLCCPSSGNRIGYVCEISFFITPWFISLSLTNEQ
ncbi:protein jagged-1b-like [Anneissia japonica]|uniref:protein jagged-1b-like n=1 Tax=Anneissia japonica TaxID=1529436 RepID=UPI0014259707|nr:protein jagged-1b-like [Anneissia japonica]